MKRLAMLLSAVVVFALGAWTPIPAVAQDFTACNGVWVVVDYGSLGGGVSTKCATSYSTGTAALRATFGAKVDGGMITAIAGKPGKKADIYKDYWSYWHASRRSDGSYSGWSYSNLGANAYHPTKGAAEGWHYVSISGSASGPGTKPPTNPVAVAKPKPRATTKAPTASASATASATAQPSVSKAPTTKAATPVATPVAAASTPSSPSPTPSAAAPAEPGEDPGSPVALIATAATLGVGGLGAGAWWLRKGRKR